MSETFDIVKHALLELKNASLNCPKNDESYHALMNKYNMLFVGENLNTIYSLELKYALEKTFNFEISITGLNRIVPKLCEQLQMKCEPLYPVEEISHNCINPDHVNYQISLY